MKIKIIPFDLETAKKIQAGEIKGRILTSSKKEVTIIKTDALGDFPIVGLVQEYSSLEIAYSFSVKGVESKNVYVLSIELPEEAPICNNPDSPICKVCSNIHCNDCQYNAPKHEFKPFDKVLVRANNEMCWKPTFYVSTEITEDNKTFYETIGGVYHEQCIPYEGNEHLVGTTDKPKDD